MSAARDKKQDDVVNSLMAMAVYSALADVLKVDEDRLESAYRLDADLRLSKRQRRELQERIAELFDIKVNNFESSATIADLVADVVTAERGISDR